MTEDTTVLHATAVVDAGALIGPGTRIWHFCHVMSGAVIGSDVVLGQNGFVGGRVRIGRGCRIQNNVSLYDGVVLEDDVFVGPSVVFTNVRRPRAAFPRKDEFEETLVEAGATIGAGAVIRCGLTIGRGAMIAAGAVVTSSVPPHALMVGVPARASGWVCLCGESPDESLVCRQCGRSYRRLDAGLESVESE